MKIKVYEDRYLVSEEIQGSQYENLATILEFEFPETINNIPTSELNKYIVFDIDSEENQSLIIDNEYKIPYEITKLGNVTFYVKLMEASEDENVTDKMIWISRGKEISFNRTEEGKTIIVIPEKLDAFNVAVTELNETTNEAKELIDTVETKLKNGEFNGKDGKDFTYEDFTPEQLEDLKGERGPSAVAMQDEEPTDKEIVIWVDTDDDSGSVVDLDKLIGDINSELATLTTVGGVE